jgi:hypothetical protein
VSLPCVSERQEDGLNSQWVGKWTHQVHASGIKLLSGEYRFLDLPTVDSADEASSPGVRSDLNHLADIDRNDLHFDTEDRVDR